MHLEWKQSIRSWIILTVFLSQKLLERINIALDIRALNFEELKSYLQSLGEPAFRNKQFFSWLHNQQIEEFSQAHNVGKKLLSALEKDGYVILNPELKQRCFKRWDGKIFDGA